MFLQAICEFAEYLSR